MTQLTVKPMEHGYGSYKCPIECKQNDEIFYHSCLCDIRLSSLCPKNNQIRDPFFELNMNLLWCCLGQFTPHHYVLM